MKDLALIGPVGSQVQLSSPLGKNLRAAALRLSDPAGPGFPPDIVRLLGSQYPASSPIGQFLWRWSEAAQTGDSGALPGLRSMVGTIRGQIGEGPLLTYIRRVLAQDVG